MLSVEGADGVHPAHQQRRAVAALRAGTARPPAFPLPERGVATARGRGQRVLPAPGARQKVNFFLYLIRIKRNIHLKHTQKREMSSSFKRIMYLFTYYF